MCSPASSHPECPQRVTSVMDMVEQQGLQSRCVLVEYVDLMRSTQQMNEDQLKALSDTYNSVYIHPESYTCACYAVGSVLQLVDKLMTSDLRNGFSVARPPGHHAHSEKMNGYCMFNNLAIAARYAQTHHQVARVLVVDWDVHHGQGIQYIFQEDPSVLYFSVHRYEEGLFWPHLAESDSNSVGSGPGEGYNINLPWNQVGMTDADYITAFQQLLLPVAYEFQPQLVLVAAGFDCMTGDPKGGYNLQSTAEGVCACLRTLLGESCPRLRSPSGPSDGALRSISRSISALYPYWTRPLSCIDTLKKMKDTSTLTTAEEMKDTSTLTTGLVYDQRMMEHHNMWDSHHPELPQRIQRIFSLHESLGLVSRCLMLPARLATEEELALSKHIAQIKATEVMKPRDLHRLGNEYNSIFISAESYRSARLAVGACFNMAQAVLNGRVRNGAAVVRPPGHHAEKDAACGFCFFNSAALTARYAQSISQKPLRVLILDWDVHHGNGTQHIFEEDDSVLYVSLHRYEDGTFFPSSEDADYSRVGLGRGAGFNVNIPWNGAKMGDAEYLAAFHSVVMPVAREFDPGLVLVSAGFDAARGDPLGGYQVTPEGYANLTHLLLGLAGGRVLVILEGGYNLTSISESMSACTSVLLGDPPPPLPCRSPPHPNAAVSINNVIRTHAPYWRSLRIQRESSVLRSFPESLRLSLPSPKHRGKRTSKGKGKKSPRQGDGGGASPGQVTSLPHAESPKTTRLSTGGQGNCDLDDLTKGLVSLDLNQTASPNPSPASVAVGGARQKLRPGPLESPVKGLNKEFLLCWFQGTLYVVDPLSWCPHLDAVKPVPAGGMDVFLPCEDCGSDAENWICLTCYKVFCGRYVNQHMVTHGLVSEHPVVLSFADLSVWCYSCEAYVHNQAVFEAKDTAHRVKFGEDMPFST
uniref:UBP-type domain-containing protein n=1 Tax=Esox lucius TaxID=8010 RepID=A0AAY5KCG4_ESOLU